MRPRADTKGVQLTLDPGPARSIPADQHLLTRAIENLLDNALRYSPPDGPPVEVALAVRPGDIVLSIRDRGPGIAREHLTRVTEPFYRADPARSRSTGGLGLGLYLARRIAEAHRGRIRARSVPGRSATFTVNLPG